jgi:hypothetical protein
MSPELSIERWSTSSASELANTQTFLSELCDVLGVERPTPPLPKMSATATPLKSASSF